MTSLPPWRAKNERERRRMFWWLNEQLDAILDNDTLEGQRANYDWFPAWVESEDFDLLAARSGSIEPLRRRYPQLAEFLHLPRPQRGKYRRKPPQSEVRFAVEDVKRIRDLWQQHYGKRNRRPDDGPSAEEIAADRWEINLEDLVRRLKSPIFCGA